MTMHSTDAGGLPRHVPSIAQIIRHRIAGAAEKRRARLEMKRLSRMPRHLLRDIGLERYAAEGDPDHWHTWR